MESFPPTRVTNYGITLFKEGYEPHITYVDPDKTVAFYINGGLAPWPGVTEGVVLAEGMDGLHPIFNHLDHRGARQDGATWADTVYDPAEMTMEITCTAQTPENLRRVIRKWFAAWDPERQGTLSWVTPDSGEWWCHPRLFRSPPNKMERSYARSKQQSFTWSIRNDDAFWRSHDSVGTFAFKFGVGNDDFARDDTGTLGPNWEQTYTGPGAGVCETDTSSWLAPGRAIWTPNDPDTFFTGTKRVVCGPYKDYNTASDAQEVDIIIANTPEFTVGAGAANDIWCRMGRDGNGDWDGYGVRARIGWGYTQISIFVNFVAVHDETLFSFFPPIIGEKFTLTCADASRVFVMKRNGVTIHTYDDVGALSALGASYRGVGFGVQAGGAILTQASPAEVRSFKTSEQVIDTFEYETLEDLDENWPLYYTGSGGGYIRADGDRAVWEDTCPGRAVTNRWLGANEVQTVTVNGSPTTWTLTYDGQTTPSISHPASAATVQTRLESLSNVGVGDVSVSGSSGGPYTVTFLNNLGTTDLDEMTGSIVSGGTNPFITVATTQEGLSRTSATDNQIVSLTLGNMFEFPFPDSAYIDIWGRMDTNDASPTGIRLRINGTRIRLSRYNGGVETLLRERQLLIPPLWGEKWSLICGTPTDPRHFKVMRGDFKVLDFKETGTGSQVGANYRGAGWGMESGDGTFSQRIPPTVLDWEFGDNGGVTQSGFINLTNIGDQPVYPDYVVYGPGTFRFADGPGKEPTVEFGPLTDNQVALIKTHPGHRAVYDISMEQSEQDLPFFQEFIKSLISLTFNNNVPPLLNWFQSLFGITPEQGVMYSLLKGRFSNPVPPRPVAGSPVTTQIAVEIVDGNADSKIVGAITPLRRWPE